jgi:hypothetical protein
MDNEIGLKYFIDSGRGDVFFGTVVKHNDGSLYFEFEDGNDVKLDLVINDIELVEQSQ